MLQNKINELEGGEFQKLCDDYLYRKFQLKNIHSLGSQEGTNKTTKGIPDSYVYHEDGTYTFIMYGNQKKYKNKIEKDIKDCLEDNTKKISRSYIKKIIICHTSTNMTTVEDRKFRELGGKTKVELIGLDTISHDLSLPRYQGIAKNYLNIKVDSGQIFSIEDFVAVYDGGGMAAPLNINMKFREQEFIEITKLIKKNNAVLVSGTSGIGKTRLVLEVCRKFENEGYQVFCIKGNGQPLYDDFTIALSEEEKYLIFLDDINNTIDIRAILSFIQSNSRIKEIKLVATVRDYEKGKVVEFFNEFQGFCEKRISSLNGEEIRTILEECLERKDKKFQDRILKISSNNIRLAILAGKSATRDISVANNPTEIYKAYYGKIFDEHLKESGYIESLFVIAFLETVEIESDDLAELLLDEFNISWGKFGRISQQLHQKELVEYYLNKVVKVNDQSFRDYILEYSLIERKIINISRILEIGLSVNRKKVVSVIQTLLNIFPSDKAANYIAQQVKSQWNNAPENEQDLYIETFYEFDFLKALHILNNRIDNFSKTDFEISDMYFDKKSKYNIINSKEVVILSNYKYSDYFKESIELLIKILKKQPDQFMDIYFAITKFIYDRSSHYTDYEKEYVLLEKIWKLRKSVNNNFDFLIFKVIDKFLVCSGTVTEEGDRPNSINFGQFSLPLTAGIRKIRTLCWQILSELYKEEKYQNRIHRILIESHWDGFGINVTPIFEYDMREVKRLFIDNWENFTFDQLLVTCKLVEYSKDFKANIDDSFKKYENSEYYRYYSVIVSDYKLEQYSDISNESIKRIKRETLSYDLDDYSELFNIAKLTEQRVDVS